MKENYDEDEENYKNNEIKEIHLIKEINEIKEIHLIKKINEIKEIKEIKEINKINGDKTFNKLRNIQILIRKESSLKGLCKYIYYYSKIIKIVIKTIKEITEQINNECQKYYASRIELENTINRKMCNNKKQLNSLVKDSQDFLKDLNVNVLKYFNNLWNEPKTIAALLLNSDNEDVKNILAPFFCHNFYQNILSPYTVEENLLFIISIMLKEEINKINSIEQLDIFLNETPCGYLLEELRRKSDIKSYSKTIIYKILEEIETNNSEKQLNINIENVENNIKNIEKELKKKYGFREFRRYYFFTKL